MICTHSSFCFILKFAQCFGLLPVCGISEKDSTFLKFSWKFKRTLFSLTFLFVTLLNTFFQVLKMFCLEKVPFYEYVTLLFFFVSSITVGNFIDIARKWPNLMKKWTAVDEAMVFYGFPLGLPTRLKSVAFIIISSAIIEHSLYLTCVSKYAKQGDTFLKSLQLHFEDSFRHVFTFIPCHILLGIILQVFNVFSTITWNFMDLFIMLISLSLSARFTQVVNHIKNLVKNEEKNHYIWREVREDYTRLNHLCKVIDDIISNLMVVSFANNLCMLTVQLYYSLKDPAINGVIDKIYHLFSFGLLILRTTAVVLYAATVDSESIKVERFLHQIKYQTAAFTGHNFFKVTKSLVLRIAGVIVSYELVLMQFNNV